jgi:formate hydrogenlyase subunit 3/multisubunit Na+/H+ antiporter MnhD subunit
VALQVAWALFGVVSGSGQGTVGAALLAANLALTVPLMLSRPPRLLMMAGAASLVGLPPFGGFPGTLLVAQAATNAGGVWLALLLLGSVLTAAAWLNYQVQGPGSGVQGQAQATLDPVGAVPEPPVRDLRFQWGALIAAQFALVALSLPLYQWLVAE